MSTESNPLPRVSIVIPCRNEVGHIARCLDSIRASTYPLDKIEAVVVDGVSDDGTRELLKEYSARHGFVRMVDNPNRKTPFAFNIGIDSASGDLVMIMSAHATYEPNAIMRSVTYSRRYNAENVGGVWVMHGRTQGLMASAIMGVLSHPFGVGGARYRTGVKEPTWVDTAAYGCYRRDVLRKVGRFNERLSHSQDMEFNLRLKRSGGRTLLAPDIEIHYSTRTEFRAFVNHTFRNGLWVVLPFAYSSIMPVSARHLVPLLFVLSAALLGGLSLVSTAAALAFKAMASIYLVFSVLSGFQIAARERRAALALLTPPLFFLLHVTYGLGSLWGLLKLPGLAMTVAAGEEGSVAYEALKRAGDFLLAAGALAVLWPVLLILAVAVKLESKGPVIYRGLRVGRGGKTFYLLKFRTMVADAERRGGSSTADDDPRITKVGAFLRATKLDELPQLWNVLVGEMSIVGPRPQVVHDVEKYSPEERKILQATPGITDFASIRFRNEGQILKGHADPDRAYVELIRPEKLRLELEYLRKRSLATDAKIVCQTALTLVGLPVRTP